MTDEVPEADAIEQDLPPGGPPARGSPADRRPVVDPDVPIADAVEQELPARGAIAEEEPSIPPEVPEADVLEQTQPAPLPDEDETAETE